MRLWQEGPSETTNIVPLNDDERLTRASQSTAEEKRGEQREGSGGQDSKNKDPLPASICFHCNLSTNRPAQIGYALVNDAVENLNPFSTLAQDAGLIKSV